jgi:5-methylcytosine-specific restriction enzyme subunit McrC
MKVFRVFEHQTIKIGQVQNGVLFERKHFYWFAQRKGSKYFSLVHEGVQFKQYVGAIQAEDITIEILPKVDQKAEDYSLWRNFLLDMLQYCQLIKLNTFNQVHISLKENTSLLDLYYQLFLQEVENLLKKGLYSTYQPEYQNSSTLKGKIVFHRHLSKNYIHRERFYSTYQSRSFDNSFNQIIYQALLHLFALGLTPQLQDQLKRLLVYFPEVSTTTLHSINYLMFNRMNSYYRVAIDMAQVILSQSGHLLKAGKTPFSGILFDMNKLFEEYIYRQLRQVIPSVQRQQATPFWNRRTIRPDITLELEGQKIVIDTKWKILNKVNPPMTDLQQAYIYSQYFDAQQTVLVYPNVYDIMNGISVPFQPDKTGKIYFCTVAFALVVQHRQLNKNLGHQLLQMLQTSIKREVSTNE